MRQAKGRAKGCVPPRPLLSCPPRKKSAEADGRAGHAGGAEQAKNQSPARPVHSLQSLVHGRDDAGKFAPLPARTINAPVAVDALRAARAVAAGAILASFRIGDVTLGEATPAMCRTFVAKRRRDAAFVERVISGVPEGGKIGDYVTEAEAAALYRQANGEHLNAAR